MKAKDLVLIAALGIGGYLVYKYFSDGGTLPGGGGGGSTTTTTETVTLPGGYEISVPNIPTPPGGFIKWTPEEIKEIHNAAGTTQRFTGVTYGDPGQPSVAFKQNTLKASPSVTGIGKAVPKVVVSAPKAVITISKPLAVSKGAKVVSVVPKTIAQQQASLAASAIKAGAPPRVVAKIKGGTFY